MSGLLRVVLVVVGGLIALCSLTTVVTVIGDAVSGASTTMTTGGALGATVFLAGMTALGAFMVWQGLKRRSAGARAVVEPSAGTADSAPAGIAFVGVGASESASDREHQILQYAEAERGRVTLAEVATHCDVTVAQAKADLDRLVQQQVAELLVTESGVLVYVFPGFLSDDEKASAHDF